MNSDMNNDMNNDVNNETYSKAGSAIVKTLLTILVLFLSLLVGFWLYFYIGGHGFSPTLSALSMLLFPTLFIGLIWCPKRLIAFIVWCGLLLIYLGALGVEHFISEYEESISIDTAPNIDAYEYLPFAEDSKIVKFDSELMFEDDPPIIDGAAALFPVYSAYVNAVYPPYVELGDEWFRYNNTVNGYEELANKMTDIFVGVYPSEEQIAYAEDCGTTFTYTPIGSEAFVFFVHKDNPIENLTSEQIRSIYSGEITNWKELGGDNKKIMAFQRNEGSGSQSMLQRFMGDMPIMEAPADERVSLMSGMLDEVADYQNRENSIGFSYRYYVEGIIQNPDIKLLSVDGVAPTAENIKNETYPIITPLYAVSYEGNDNENVAALLDWMTGEEGQYILEETGYVGLP